MVEVFFRYDDYSSLSNAAADQGVIEAFRRRRVACTFAVVPAITSIYPWVEGRDQQELILDGAKAAALKSAVESGAVDLALHGWRHLANEHTRHPDPSEFKGLGYEAQVEILSRGRDFLEQISGVRPKLFVPPWNSYDQVTERALEATGFIGLSASRNSPVPAPRGALKFAPITTEVMGLRRAVELASSGKHIGASVGVMMHPYDFKEAGDSARAVISIPEFEELLEWLQRKDVRILSISQWLEDKAIPENRRRFQANRPSAFENCYPPFIKKVDDDPIYESTAVAKRMKLHRNACFFGTMLLLVIAGGLAATGMIATAGASLAYTPIIVASVSAIGIGALALRGIRARALYLRGAAIVAVLLGALIASGMRMG